MQVLKSIKNQKLFHKQVGKKKSISHPNKKKSKNKKAPQEEKANSQQVSKFLWLEPETMLDNSKKFSTCCAK